MAFGNILSGFSNRMVQDIVAEREARRKAEDADIDYQMEIINNLTKNPNVNPNILNRAISDLAALNAAKKPGARKSTGSMYGGSEVPVSQLIQSIASGIMPMHGPTTEQVQRPVGEQIEMTRGAELQPFNPQSLPQIKPGGMDGMDTVVPPAPLGPPPMITPLQRAAKQAEMKTQLLPPEKQPLFRSPDEMAAEEGQAAGIRAGSIAKAQRKAGLDAWVEAGGDPQKYMDAELEKMSGRTTMADRTQVVDGGYFDVDGRTIHAVRRIKPDGTFEVLDSASGLPLPPSAQATFAPKPEADPKVAGDLKFGDVVRQMNEERAAAGKPPLSATETMALQDKWQSSNAPRVTNNILAQPMPGSTLNPRQAAIINPLINNYRNSAPVKAVARTAPLEGAIQRIKADPNNAFTQLNIIYGYIQALDTYQSTVREGEIGLTQQTMSLKERLKMRIQQVNDAKILSPESAVGIATEAEMLINDIKRSASDAARTFKAQANINGLGSTWDQYMQEAYEAPVQKSMNDYMKTKVPTPPVSPIAPMPSHR